jgi:hypothetical protein
MASSGVLRHVALVKTHVSEELRISLIRVTRIGEQGTFAIIRTRVLADNYGKLSLYTDSFHPDEGGSKFFRNIGSYKSHMA